MFHLNAEGPKTDFLLQNISSVNIDIVLEIQNDLDPYDMTSLVFLLYDIPDTALQCLIVYQKVSKDTKNDNMNLLYKWASYAQTRPTWKYEFLEALCICRLYNILRKLGFDISKLKQHYLPNNISFSIHISQIKKILYRLCESISTETLQIFKKTLLSYDIDTTKYESCELVFLELMCQKFILIPQNDSKKQSKVDLSRLSEILEHFPTLSSFAVHLNEFQSMLNINEKPVLQELKMTSVKKNSTTFDNSNKNLSKYGKTDLDEFYEHFNQLNLDDISINLRSDNEHSHRDSYPILNPKRVGVCCIINQEDFYPSKESIIKKVHINLTTRHGSTKDQNALEKTMKALNFEVIVRKNLDHKEFFDFIKYVLKNSVLKDDSIFILCLLSHGVRGHIYAADSVKIKVEEIQHLLDSDMAVNLYGKPKVLILQACQVNDEPSPIQGLVPDGPSSEFFLRKSDFLIYWATAPEYEAFRQESKGSLFIQFLCIVIKNKGHQEHIYDIFTKVTNIVTKICCKVEKLQVPIFESTLRKKLYLYKCT